MKTFLKPLSFAEEQFYLLQLQRGDPEAKNILIEHNLRLVAHVAKKYQGCDEDQDDLISIGTIGLIKAISTFDPSRTSKLSTYAAGYPYGELLDQGSFPRYSADPFRTQHGLSGSSCLCSAS